jgi:hypothetical protein
MEDLDRAYDRWENANAAGNQQAANNAWNQIRAIQSQAASC